MFEPVQIFEFSKKVTVFCATITVFHIFKEFIRCESGLKSLMMGSITTSLICVIKIENALNIEKPVTRNRNKSHINLKNLLLFSFIHINTIFSFSFFVAINNLQPLDYSLQQI